MAGFKSQPQTRSAHLFLRRPSRITAKAACPARLDPRRHRETIAIIEEANRTPAMPRWTDYDTGRMRGVLSSSPARVNEAGLFSRRLDCFAYARNDVASLFAASAPSLRGALATKQSSSCFVAFWIAFAFAKASADAVAYARNDVERAAKLLRHF